MITRSEDVAVSAGVSRATVSQILNGRGERFSEATRKRVRQAAKDLDYQPSVAARTLARGSSDFVIALIPNTTFGGNLQDLFERATEELATIGLTLVLQLSTPSTKPLDRVISGMAPKAVISFTPFTPEERALLAGRGVLTFDPSTTAGEKNPNHDIGVLQATHLIDRGHTRLAFAYLQDSRQDPFGQERESGVRAECARRGLSEPLILRLDIDPDDALKAVDMLEPPGVAVACYNDDVAIALLSAAAKRKWRVPEDIALIGMDYTPLSRVLEPPLTTIAFDMKEASRAAMAGILRELGNLPGPPAPRNLELRLIPGGTA
ncbi:LacI family DNA-binding transcriptional regulator [Arthrobacter sp. MDT1-48-3]